MEPVEVTLFTRRNCSLCDKARAAMDASGLAIHVTEVDIDDDPELRRRYNDDVPVIRIGAVEAFRQKVTAAEFRDFVLRGPTVSTALAGESCIPCRGGVPPLAGEELRQLVAELGGGWRVVEDHHLEKE